MIKRVPAHITTDGKPFLTLDEAQTHELEIILEGEGEPDNAAPFPPDRHDTIAQLSAWIVKHKDRIVDVLTTTKTSRQGGRRVNGGTKNIRTKAQIAADKKTAAVNAVLQDGKQ